MIEQQALAGEDCRSSYSGLYFMNTNAASPYALGRISEMMQTKNLKTISFDPIRNVDPFLREIDTFGKIEGTFNNLPYQNTPSDDASYFVSEGSEEIAHNFVESLKRGVGKPSRVKFVNVKVRKSSKLLRDDTKLSKAN